MWASPIHNMDRQADGFQVDTSDRAPASYSRPSGVRRSIHSSASARVMSWSGLPRRFSRRSTPFSPRHSTASVFSRSTWLLRAFPAPPPPPPPPCRLFGGFARFCPPFPPPASLRGGRFLRLPIRGVLLGGCTP